MINSVCASKSYDNELFTEERYCIECDKEIVDGNKFALINGDLVCLDCITKASAKDILDWFGVTIEVSY